MSMIDVRDQIRLSLKEVIAIVISGIQHRLLRSTLTMSVILLAVAFFMSMLSESVFIKSTGRAVQAEILSKKAPVIQLRKMFSKPSGKILRKRLVLADDAEIKSMSAITSIPLEDIQRLSKQCRRMKIYHAFFKKLDVGKRLVLIGKRKGDEVFDYLKDNKVWLDFLKALDPMHSVKIPGKVDEFRGFLDRFDTFKNDFNLFFLSWNLSVDQFVKQAENFMATSDEENWIRNANTIQLQNFCELATKNFFQVDLPFAEKMKKSFRNEY